MMTLEIIKTIVLACQVNTGFQASNAHELIDKYQKKCQNDLIECVEKMNKKTGRWSEYRLINCLKER